MSAMVNGKPKKNLAEQFSTIRGDYDMSRESRFVRRRTGLAPQGGTADYHYRNESQYYTDIEKARDMDRNDSIVGQTIDRAVANIVQDGFTLDPKTGDKKLDAELWARWLEWSEDRDQCDLAGEFCWHDFEVHAMRSMLLDGDVVGLACEDGELQMVEAHNIKTSTKIENTVLGITKDQYNRRLRYWITSDPIESYQTSTSLSASSVEVRDEYGFRQVFHVYNPKRMTQTRGVTAFAPIFSQAGMFEDIQFAKLVQQQVVSCFAIFRKQTATPDLPSTTPGYGASTIETSAAGTRYIEGIAPGMEIIGKPGEELQGFSPNVPNSEYFEHVRLMLQIIGVNLGLPLCLVLMDGSETNFSGWRGAVDEARKGFRANQRNLLERFHRPVYQWKVRQWLADDPAMQTAADKSKVNLFGHKWNAPTWAYIDPVGDAQGDALRLQNGLTSPRRLHAERGRDWEEVADETIADNAYAILSAKKQAAAINKKFPNEPPVHWRELISLPMPSGIQMTMQDPNVVEAQTLAARDEQQTQEAVAND